jgi:hypothetical protein
MDVKTAYVAMEALNSLNSKPYYSPKNSMEFFYSRVEMFGYKNFTPA